MALSIDWATGVITVPKADLTLVSGTLYKLDTQAFRLELKALEASVYGIVNLKNQLHSTQVTVGGITYARAIQILPPYSVEFEDGQYSVRLEKSNNNIWDVEAGILVQNQVQVIPTNAAGLITTTSGSGVTEQDKTDIINGVWDETLSSHDSTGSTGLALKYSAARTIRDPLALGGTINSITLDAGASALTDAYNNALVVITDGTGEGQVRTILSYDGTTKIAYVSLNWVTIPDETSVFSIIADSGPLTIVSGRIESSTNTTAVLEDVSIMSDIDGIYDEALILISSGANAGQVRRVTGYNATTRTVSIHKAWASNPGAADTYQILPSASVRVNEIESGELDNIGSAVWSDTIGAAIATMTTELHKLQGLVAGKPMTVTPTSRTVDDIELVISGDGENESIVERR